MPLLSPYFGKATVLKPPPVSPPTRSDSVMYFESQWSEPCMLRPDLIIQEVTSAAV